MDPRDLRQALGAFATGITVVTTHGPEGPVGVTANSFNSVSMDPPLVLWSLSKQSGSLPAFQAHRRWVINVLAETQRELSNQFARRGPDKFAGVDAVADDAGPILTGTLATFVCDTEHEYDGGDHIILVGRVTRFERSPAGPPLLYFRGGYRELSAPDHPFPVDEDWQSWSQ